MSAIRHSLDDRCAPVAGRKHGTRVHYRMADPKVFDPLDIARAMFQSHVASVQEMVGGVDG